MRTRPWLLAATLTLGGLLLLAVALIALLPVIPLAGLAANRFSAALGRDVQVAALRVTPGRWIGVELRGLVVPNLPGGSRPDMLTVPQGSAELDLWTLLSGPITLRHVQVDGMDLLLERIGPGRQPNWRNHPRPHPQTGPAQPDYAWFPNILDATITAAITVRTTAGHNLVTKLDGMRIAGSGASQPVRLTGPGSYQGVPVQVAITAASFDAIRAAPTPVGAEVLMIAGDTKLGFKGTLRAPLDVNGAEGELTFDMPTPDALFRIAGLKPGAAPVPPLHLLATLDRQDPEWHLANTTGALGGSRLRGGDIDLIESHPDHLALALDFETLDLDSLLATGREPAPPAGSPATDIVPAPSPDPQLDLKLSAGKLSYRSFTVQDPNLDAKIGPGRADIAALGFGAFGGRVDAHGSLTAHDGSALAEASARADGLDLQAIRRAAGTGPIPASGRVDAVAELRAEGATLEAARQNARLDAVLTLAGGSIAREAIEAASTDARALFRSARGYVPVSCALGIVSVRDDVATISPLRIRSTVGTVAGRGRIDLARGTVDVTVASESATTGAFALDVPLHIAGPLADPAITPAELSAHARAQLAMSDNAAHLPPDLRAAARRSPCLERAR